MARTRCGKKLKTSARSTPIEKQSKKAKQNAKRMVDEIETSGTPGNSNSFGCKRQAIPDDEMHSKDQNLKISASTTPVEEQSLCATEQVVDEIEMSGTLSNDNSFARFKEKYEKVENLPNSLDQIEEALKDLVVQWESNKDLELPNSFTQHMLSKYISSYTCLEKVVKQTRVTEDGRLEKEKDNKTTSIEETKVVIDTAPLQSPSEDDIQASECHSSWESVKASAELSRGAPRKLCFSAQENLEAALDTLQKLKELYPAVRVAKRISPAVRQAMRINNLIMAVKFTMIVTENILKTIRGPQKACMENLENQTGVEGDRRLEKEESEKTASVEETKEVVMNTAPFQSPSEGDFWDKRISTLFDELRNCLNSSKSVKDQLCLMHLSQKLYYSAEGNLEAAMDVLEHVKEYYPSNKKIDKGLKRIQRYMIPVERTVSPRRSTQLVKLIVMQKYECKLCNTAVKSREFKEHRIVKHLKMKEKRSKMKLLSSQVNRKSKKQNNIKRILKSTKKAKQHQANLPSHLKEGGEIDGKRHKKKEEESKMKPGSSQVNQKNDIDNIEDDDDRVDEEMDEDIDEGEKENNKNKEEQKSHKGRKLQNNIDANQAATESAQSPKKGGRKDEEDDDSEEDLDLNLGDLDGIDDDDDDDDDDSLDENVDEKENDEKENSQKRGKLQNNINDEDDDDDDEDSEDISDIEDDGDRLDDDIEDDGDRLDDDIEDDESLDEVDKGNGNTCVNNEKKKQAEKRPLKNMKKQTWENAPPTKKAKKINK